MFSNVFKYHSLCQVKSVIRRGGGDTESQGGKFGNCCTTWWMLKASVVLGHWIQGKKRHQDNMAACDKVRKPLLLLLRWKPVVTVAGTRVAPADLQVRLGSSLVPCTCITQGSFCLEDLMTQRTSKQSKKGGREEETQKRFAGCSTKVFTGWCI